MGIFFSSDELARSIDRSIKSALLVDPKGVRDVDEETHRRVESISGEMGANFSWPRLAVAIVLLGAILGAAIYTGQKPALNQIYEALVHGFEVLLGGLVGLIVGEGAKH